MAKPVILIIINKIGRGGAEMMLLGTLKELNTRYKIVLVSLGGIHNHEIEESELVNYTHYNLRVNNLLKFGIAIFRLKRIIKLHNVNLVHAHLYQSTIMARMACPRKIPFLFSVHSQLSKYANRSKRILERITLRKKDILVAVSEDCRSDYEKHFGTPSKQYVLRNYIGSSFFKVQHPVFETGETLRIIAVGNVSPVKNYEVLIRAFSQLKNEKVQLDIFGRPEQPLFDKLNDRVKKGKLNIQFRGLTCQVAKELSEHHVFVSSSAHEGFGMTVIEAMAAGLPVITSDIPVFREITMNHALFFNPHQPDSFVSIVKDVINGKYDLKTLSQKGRQVAENYRKEAYMDRLIKIYDENLGGNR